ncbi:hypothetical protein [Ectopseudomonas mendocina]|uniref:hypothetical protein n=1 Tax=Ectopseudomonas mendocina TaxID=300 RepID=UPI000474BE5E|nr:hypothetical protein [Pseudomonas mendocina]
MADNGLRETLVFSSSAAAAATFGERNGRRLSKEIRTIHHEANGIYGHRQIKAELAAMGMRAVDTGLLA